MAEGKKDRYPGLNPFKREDEDIYFGRNAEILDLYAQIKANPLVVLFGKSGIGKEFINQCRFGS